MQQKITAAIAASTGTQVPALQREQLVALIRENVSELAAAGDYEGLDETLSVVGFDSCRNDDSCDSLAAAISALAPTTDDDTLGFVASCAVFYRWRKSSGVEHADAIARAAIEPLGVKFAPCGCFAVIRGSAAACAHCGSMASAS
jgi:hypothetical protein